MNTSKPKTYETWECADKSILLVPSENLDQHYEIKGFEPVNKLYEFTATTWEEANSIHQLRMGHPPYKPMGDSKLCPNCKKTHYYPEGSGVCALCGEIN